MSLAELIIGAALVVILFVYLTVATIFPDRFRP